MLSANFIGPLRIKNDLGVIYSGYTKSLKPSMEIWIGAMCFSSVHLTVSQSLKLIKLD